MAAAMAGGAAAAALRLGPRSRELAVLELAELEKGVVNTAAPSDDGLPIVETDLALQDVSSDEEFYKRSKAWFNLLPVRKNFFLEAKRPCVICLTEKEHTLVPPHAPRNAPNVPSEAVEDHRFCTDCWEDFLRHRTSTTSSMTCPVCRGEIIIPEVWTQRLQLPQRWSQEEVVILRGLGSVDLDPISFDNNSLPVIPAAEAGQFNGFYQFEPLFYHKSFDRFVPWEQREKTMVFSCTMGCSAHNLTAKEVKLALVHASLDGKRYSWYLTEFRDEDANSPIIYARTKLRKSPTYRVPWLTVTPGGDIKPSDLEDVHLITAWDALRFDTPLKWGVTVAIVGAIVFWCKTKEKDD